MVSNSKGLNMQANADVINVDNTIIFRCDEWRDGNISEFDGHVQSVREDGVDVVYLSGHRSRNDFIPFKDIIAKLDKRKPYISLKNAPYRGHFIEFEPQGTPDESTEQNRSSTES